MSGRHKLIKYRNEAGRIVYRREFPRWKVIVFVKGKRLDKVPLFYEPKEAQELVARLTAKGAKAHVVCRTSPRFSPKGTPDDEEMMWCPYCRRWRWFDVPKDRGPFTNLEIKCCKWCLISEEDYHVKYYNGTWDGRRKRRKRSKNRRRRKR